MDTFRLFFIITMIFAALAPVAKADGKYPEINGAQVFVMDKRYKDDVGAFFKEVKAKGVDTVFFRVFHNSGDRPHFGLNLACDSGVYFKTDELCTVADILPAVTAAAKQNDIKIFAWMATRSLTELKSGDDLSSSFSPEGGLTGGYGANIFKYNVRQKLIKLFSDLAKNDIDGILFQDDFILKYSEGADSYATILYEHETGMKANPEIFFKSVKFYNGKQVFSGFTEDFFIWAKWKMSKLALLFKELKSAAVKENPDILFAANIYYETPIEPISALAWYAQSLETLDSAGADYFAVMGYFEQIAKEGRLRINEAAVKVGDIAKAASDTIGDSRRIVMKLQSGSFEKPGSKIPLNIFNRICNEVHQVDNISITLVPIFSSDDIVGNCF